jgi:hypothetical protein
MTNPNEIAAPRIPEDPPELNVFRSAAETVCRPCFFWDPGNECPRKDAGCLCLPRFRPDGIRVIYKKRLLYGNEED